MEQMAYTKKEFCAAFRTNPHRFYDEIRAGRLRAYKVGNRVMVSAQAALEWQAALETQPVEIRPTVGVKRRTPSAKELAFLAAQMALPEMADVVPLGEVVKPIGAGLEQLAGAPAKRGPGRPRKHPLPLAPAYPETSPEVIKELRRIRAEGGKVSIFPFEEKKTRLAPGL